MPKGSSEEVQVLHFFEAGPIEKVEAVFNIVTEKMRERRQRERGPVDADYGTLRRRRRRNQDTAQLSEVPDRPEQ